jgi:hypothetical protein
MPDENKKYKIFIHTERPEGEYMPIWAGRWFAVV